jgi:ATP-binding cassette subfamily B protein
MRRLWHRALASLRPEADLAPLVDHAPGMTLVEVLRRFWPRLRPLKWWLVLAMLLVAAAPAIEVVEILLFQRLVDDVLVPEEWQPLITLVLLYVGLNLASAVVSGFDDYLSTWISQRFLLGLRTDVFRHVLSLPTQVHDRRRLGDVMSRITSDVAAVETFMIGHLAGGIDSVVRLVFFVGALFWLQWELALASMVVIPLFWWISRRFADFVKSLSRERRRRSGSLSAITEESLANGPLVQAYNREQEAVQKYHRQNEAIVSAELAGSRVRGVFLPLVDLAELAGLLLVIAMGVWTLQTDRLTLGGLLAFLTLMAQCYRPVLDLADLLPAMYSATAGIERIVELLDEEPPSDRPGAVALRDPRGPIRLDGVTVRCVRSTWRSRRGSWSLSPGPVARASPPWPGCSPVMSIQRRERCGSAARTCATPPSRRCATPSPSCCRRPCCSMRPSPRTSRSLGPTRPTRRCAPLLGPPMPTSSYARCRRATALGSGSAAGHCPAGSGNGWRWRGRSCGTARC